MPLQMLNCSKNVPLRLTSPSTGSGVEVPRNIWYLSNNGKNYNPLSKAIRYLKPVYQDRLLRHLHGSRRTVKGLIPHNVAHSWFCFFHLYAMKDGIATVSRFKRSARV